MPTSGIVCEWVAQDVTCGMQGSIAYWSDPSLHAQTAGLGPSLLMLAIMQIAEIACQQHTEGDELFDKIRWAAPEETLKSCARQGMAGLPMM